MEERSPVISPHESVSRIYEPDSETVISIDEVRDCTLIDFHVRLPRYQQQQLQKVRLLTGMTIQEIVMGALEDKINTMYPMERK
jgi:hypothetical protein